MNRKNINQIIFSLIFIILFGIIFGTQLIDLINMTNSNGITYEIILTVLSIIVSATGIYISLLYGIVKVINSTKESSGGIKNDKKKEKQKN